MKDFTPPTSNKMHVLHAIHARAALDAARAELQAESTYLREQHGEDSPAYVAAIQSSAAAAHFREAKKVLDAAEKALRASGGWVGPHK